MPHDFYNLLQKHFPGRKLKPVDHSLARIAKKHLDSLAKPPGSLGRLEDIAIRLFEISGGRTPLAVDPSILFTVAGDHGVACHKVSPYPQAVTRQMVENFLKGGAAINALCDAFGISLKIVDAGCRGGSFPAHPALIDRRIGNGTRDFTVDAAMTNKECEKALMSGFELGLDAAGNYGSISTGEMGIGNSTAATALFCAFLNLPPEKVAGPGAGANQKMIGQKSEIVSMALKKHEASIRSGDPYAILAALGGYEIALIAGIMLSCACSSLPFLVDGFIATSAYVTAIKIYPALSDYAFLAHTSAEPAYKAIVSCLPDHHAPLLDLSMRLGEGTGCAMALSILRGACAIYNSMATMADANVSATEEDRIA